MKEVLKIKLIRRIIDHGYEKALTYTENDEEKEYMNIHSKKNRQELIEEITKIKSNKPVSQTPLKFCIGQCQREFIPRNGNLQIYCPSCDRVLNERPIKDFKDI